MNFEEWFKQESERFSKNTHGEFSYTSEDEVEFRRVWEAAQAKWQSLLTAPKDKDILLLTKHGDVATGYWGYEDREDPGQWMWFDGEPVQQDVVGWMPKEWLVREE